MGGRRRHGTIGEYVSNWREYDAPFATKLRLVLRNYWIRARTLSNCCGNDGEPGC